MTISKLDEFAKNGERNTSNLNLAYGFPSDQKPQRRWFNWLFNTLAVKINEVIDQVNTPINAATTAQSGLVKLVNDLITGGIDKALTAEQGKLLKLALEQKVDRSDVAAIQGPTKVVAAGTMQHGNPHVMLSGTSGWYFQGQTLMNNKGIQINDNLILLLTPENGGDGGWYVTRSNTGFSFSFQGRSGTSRVGYGGRANWAVIAIS